MAGRRFAAIGVGSFELELGIYELDAKYGIRSRSAARPTTPGGSAIRRRRRSPRSFRIS